MFGCFFGHKFKKIVFTTMTEYGIHFKTNTELENKVYVMEKVCEKCGESHLYLENNKWMEDLSHEQIVYELSRNGIYYEE